MSANELVQAAVRRTPTHGTASLDVVGHEAAGNAAVVVLRWIEGPPPRVVAGWLQWPNDTVKGEATVRVPLDGRTPPTVISRTTEQAAW